jgi:tripartite-type tricarboxylate transporter receptor subunit TctC
VPGYEFQAWFVIVAPVATPAPILERLNAEFNRVLSVADVRDRLLNEGGMQPVGGSAAQFAALIASEKDHWGKLVKETGARVD